MNYIPRIAEMLGVRIGEKFKIKSDGITSDYVYRITECSAECCVFDECWCESIAVLGALLSGKYEIVKLPFEPKEGEPYWVATWDPNENTLTTCKAPWHNRADCWADKYCGNVFRTESEAEAHKYEIYEKLKGKKWEEKE